MLIKWINRAEKGGAAAYDAGLREGDILLRLANKPVPQTPNKLNEFVKLNFKVGEALPITVLREGRQRELQWPLVE